MSSTSCGTTKMSANPPMRSEVWKLSGSLNRTSPRISPSIDLSFEPSQNVRPKLAHVAGAQGDDQVTGPADLGHVVDDAGAIAAEKRHVAVAVGSNAVRQILGAHAGDGR